MRKMCAFSYFLKSRLIHPAIDVASMQIAMRSQGNLAEDMSRAGVPACELNEEFDLPRRSVAKAGAAGGFTVPDRKVWPSARTDCAGLHKLLSSRGEDFHRRPGL